MLTNLQKARVAAVKTFFCNVEDADTALGVYERLTDMAGADADPNTLEHPVWYRFCEMTAGDLLDEVDGVANIVIEALGPGDSKVVTFNLSFIVQDNGELDEKSLMAGVLSGLEFMHQDGALTAPADESTLIESWTMAHIGTVATL